MKVGIIVHSYTENTLSVAQKLLKKLEKKGHQVTLDRVIASNENPNASGNVVLKAIPDTSLYDTIIFAAPVRAFSLSPIMKVYLNQIADLDGKNVGCFVTEQLPLPWMGGKQAIKAMTHYIEKKGGHLLVTGIVNWSNKNRDIMINEVVDRFTGIV